MPKHIAFETKKDLLKIGAAYLLILAVGIEGRASLPLGSIASDWPLVVVWLLICLGACGVVLTLIALVFRTRLAKEFPSVSKGGDGAFPRA